MTDEAHLPGVHDFDVTGRRLVYLAAERTLMAWLRTALGTMAFGFVVDRFQFFLLSSGLMPASEGTAATFDYMGTVIVFVGALFAAIAAVRYLGFARRYQEHGDTTPGHGLLVGSLFAILLAALGCALALFLLTVTP